jgi:hypothetical protein
MPPIMIAIIRIIATTTTVEPSIMGIRLCGWPTNVA